MEKENQIIKVSKQEAIRLEIAREYIEHLLNLFLKYDISIKNKEVLSKNKKLLYDISFCLKIIGECFHADYAPNIYKNKIIDKYAKQIYLIRDYLIKYIVFTNEISGL